ncbi:MAG TPA: formate dehydrogenase accessory sulfurtransferase FdhD [Vicinamibacterales bacterium]|jgi:FdhD protein
MAADPSALFRTIDLTRVRAGGASRAHDLAATEEPLEVRLHGEPFSVIMRTPGHDRELAAGFLLAEQVIQRASDVRSIAHRRDLAGDLDTNVVNVMFSDSHAAELPRLLEGRRQTSTASSCGLCGRRSIESLALDVPPLASTWTIRAVTVARLPEELRRAQTAFDETGGLHAAGVFSPGGERLDAAEDVGRHNAVDKIVGRALMAGTLPLSACVLMVSGRASFEIVQKAHIAGLPIVAAVSAPSTLAIELADRAGITLIGFVRGDSFNVYTHSARVLI